MRATEGIGLDCIARPPRVYLDTNHLINIAKVRHGEALQNRQHEEAYRRIDEYMKASCGLFFNPFATLEWIEGKATLESARQIAAIVDSANLKYLLEADYLVYTREILHQCYKQDSHIRVPSIPRFPQNISHNSTLFSVLGILAAEVPDYFDDDRLIRLQKEQIPIEIPVPSVLEWVEATLMWKDKNAETYQERIDGFRSALAEDIARRHEYFNDRRRYQRNWIKGLLKIGRILRTFNPAIDVDSVLDNIDIRECPAVDLYWTVREKRMRSGIPPNDNDVDDYMYIPAIPYADIVLIERQLRGFLLQADRSLESKVFSKVSDALTAIENQRFVW